MCVELLPYIKKNSTFQWDYVFLLPPLAITMNSLGLEIKSEDLNRQVIVTCPLQTTSQNSHFIRLLLFYLTPFLVDR